MNLRRGTYNECVCYPTKLCICWHLDAGMPPEWIRPLKSWWLATLYLGLQIKHVPPDQMMPLIAFNMSPLSRYDANPPNTQVYSVALSISIASTQSRSNGISSRIAGIRFSYLTLVKHLQTITQRKGSSPQKQAHRTVDHAAFFLNSRKKSGVYMQC